MTGHTSLAMAPIHSSFLLFHPGLICFAKNRNLLKRSQQAPRECRGKSPGKRGGLTGGERSPVTPAFPSPPRLPLSRAVGRLYRFAPFSGLPLDTASTVCFPAYNSFIIFKNLLFFHRLYGGLTDKYVSAYGVC